MAPTVVSSCFSVKHKNSKAATHCLLMNHSEHVRWKHNKPTQLYSKFILGKKTSHKSPTKGFIKEMVQHFWSCTGLSIHVAELNPAAGLLSVKTGNRKIACLAL